MDGNDDLETKLTGAEKIYIKKKIIYWIIAFAWQNNYSEWGHI